MVTWSVGRSNRTIVGLKLPYRALARRFKVRSNRTIVGLKPTIGTIELSGKIAAIAPLWD